jgi:hypothetical protein
MKIKGARVTNPRTGLLSSPGKILDLGMIFLFYSAVRVE